ncbi:MAG: acetyltransferase [Candidatus Eremiobacteraeota bacterium]|uniref:Putative Transferase hexapeptide repeat containing protein n=1 Tax=mine drainage metagenome TaxID=410659 RepID=E6PC97_9ZZZZ|nr:acetyltransferase [Candidatus Eremiobacteraeota bacterium]
MAKIIVFGTGKVADVLYHHVVAAKHHDIVAFTTDVEHLPAAGTFHDRPVVPFDRVVESFPPDAFQMLVAIGYHGLNGLRARRYAEAKAKGYTMASYVSDRACVGDWLVAGDNCIILDGATVEPGVRLGNNVVLWSNVLIGHHTTIADHVWIAANSTFGGSAFLGERSFVGLGVTVGHEVEIGEQSFLGSGAIVTKCADAKSVFIEKNTDLFRLNSDMYMKISKLR